LCHGTTRQDGQPHSRARLWAREFSKRFEIEGSSRDFTGTSKNEFPERFAAAADTRDFTRVEFANRVLSDGVPEHIRSDNGPEFVAKSVQDWIGAVGAKTAYIERGSPWENGFIESFNARLRDELLDGEIFYSLAEARIVIESWRRHYNTDLMDHWATSRRPLKSSFPRSPRGRLRNPDQLRRPR
jgi:transposase InsO family protein